MLKGKIEDINLVNLIQMLAQEGKTGKLTVHRDELMVGEVGLREGRLVYAKQEQLSGEKAFLRVMNLDRGEFVFEEGFETEETNISGSLEMLLLEAVRKKDEARQRKQVILNKIKTLLENKNFEVLVSEKYYDLFLNFNKIGEVVDGGKVQYIWIDKKEQNSFLLTCSPFVIEVRFKQKIHPEEIYQLISRSELIEDF